MHKVVETESVHVRALSATGLHERFATLWMGEGEAERELVHRIPRALARLDGRVRLRQ